MTRLAAVALALLALQSPSYELVMAGGRVLDPETGLDAVRHVGVSEGRITRTASPLAGRIVLDAGGHVVAPGFVDLHSHGQDAANDRLKALDGDAES